MRWNHIFNPKVFSNFTGVISNYSYQIADPQEVGSFTGKSNIVNFALKADFGWAIAPINTINFGIHSILHKLKPGERTPFDENASTIETILDNEHALESTVYVSHMAKLSDQLSLQYGIRLSSLLNLGSEEAYTYARNQPKSDFSIIDTVSYSKREVFQRRSGWEPRLSINYQFNGSNAIKGSYTKTYQYIHLISNTVAPSPTDIWKLSDTHINPTISNHYSLGFYKNFRESRWESSIEVYYKELQNIVDFKPGADLLFNENLETELINGKGQSYGMEFFLKRKVGKIRGWLSYTLSKSEQKFKDQFEELTINNGQFFPTESDKTNDITLVTVMSLSDRVSISSSFNYSTGRPITLPVGKFILDAKIVPHFVDRNQSRLTDYNRLDLSLKLQGKRNKKSGISRKAEDYWLFSLYNVYAQKNIYSYFFRESETKPGITEAIPYSIFRTIIPAVTYNFKF
ncbi:MAG: TonB-dependent receptor [Cytophagales bacterium]|nr:TonB-dependent receptor [Cytophagales bacterium]